MANFESSLPRVRVPLKPGELCRLKRHFRGAVREVIGYLERKALQRHDRFVFATEKTIASWCRRYQGKRYSYNYIRHCLEFLRDLGLISERHQRDGRWGFHVLHHDQVCYGTETECRWAGIDPPKAGESEENCLARAHGMIPSEHTREHTAEHTPDHTPEHTAEHTTSPSRAHPRAHDRLSNDTCNGNTQNDLPTDRAHELAPSRVSRVLAVGAVGAEGAGGTPQKCEQGNGLTAASADILTNEQILKDEQSNGSGQGNEQDEQSHTLKEISYALDCLNESTYVAQITDGELAIDREYSYWRELVECCQHCVEVFGHRKFEGRKTLADVMDSAMHHLREKYNVNAPAAWLPVIKKLRKGGPVSQIDCAFCVPYVPGDESEAVSGGE